MNRRRRPQPSPGEDLADMTMFRRCSPQERRWISTISTPVDFPEGHQLCEVGTFGREVFVIVEGEVEVRTNDRVLAVAGPGETIGEVALLDAGPRTATAIARTPVRALVMDRREFSSLLSQVPTVAQALLAATAARLRSADETR